MDTLGKRVKKVIVHNGATMTSFAKELNISQSMVSKICADKATPSERTISDICRIYNINKDWLLNGDGDMVNAQSLEDELTNYFDTDNGATLNDDIKRTLISALVGTPPVAWPLVADSLRRISDGIKNHPGSADSYMDGFREGVRLAEKVEEMIKGLSWEPKE